MACPKYHRWYGLSISDDGDRFRCSYSIGKPKVTKKPELRKSINKNVQDWILSRLRFKQCPCVQSELLPVKETIAPTEKEVEPT